MVGLCLFCVGLLLGFLTFFAELYILQVFVCVTHIRPKLSALFDRKSLPSMGGALFKNLEAIKELGGSIVVGYFW